MRESSKRKVTEAFIIVATFSRENRNGKNRGEEKGIKQKGRERNKRKVERIGQIFFGYFVLSRWRFYVPEDRWN